MEKRQSFNAILSQQMNLQVAFLKPNFVDLPFNGARRQWRETICQSLSRVGVVATGPDVQLGAHSLALCSRR